MRSTLLAALALSLCFACAPDEPPPPPPAPGEPVAGLSTGERGRFLLGKALFERIATADEGLGPLYNADRCSSCHDQPAIGGGGDAVPVLKATHYADGRCDPLRSLGGDNIQLRATDPLIALGLGPETVPAEATATARVTAPTLLGLGLVEAVPEAAFVELANRDDTLVTGRLPRLEDGRYARFGRKGDAATVADFVDTALRFELGLTTVPHPEEETRNGVPVPPEADLMAEPEIDAETMGILVDYVRYLAPPAPEGGLEGEALESVTRGEAIFRQIGCTSCHQEELRTGDVPEAALSQQVIRPYSDFLLHDMGPGLADVCGLDAAPGELRTAPLWGLRFKSRYLHDGRADDLATAISLHGGEAEGARDAYVSLPASGQADLLRFLDTR